MSDARFHSLVTALENTGMPWQEAISQAAWEIDHPAVTLRPHEAPTGVPGVFSVAS